MKDDAAHVGREGGLSLVPDVLFDKSFSSKHNKRGRHARGGLSGIALQCRRYACLLSFAIVATFVLILFLSDFIHQIRDAGDKVPAREIKSMVVSNEEYEKNESLKGIASFEKAVEIGLNPSIKDKRHLATPIIEHENPAPSSQRLKSDLNNQGTKDLLDEMRPPTAFPPPDQLTGHEKERLHSPAAVESRGNIANHEKANTPTLLDPSRFVPPACSRKNTRVSRLPTCDMPALNVKRPTALRLWLADRKKADPSFDETTLEGKAQIPELIWSVPHGLTYFRPPRYGQKDLTFNGSMPAESFFVLYDEKEWDSYCEAILGAGEDKGKVVEANEPSNIPSIHNRSSVPQNGIVIPDKFLLGIINYNSEWEQEMIKGQLLPPLFVMDRRKMRHKHKREADDKKEKENSYDTDFPIVMTLLMIADGYGLYAPDVVADIAATYACFREHLLMWYDPSVVNRVFAHHERTTAFYLSNDQTAPPENSAEVLNIYEMVRHGDWRVEVEAPIHFRGGQSSPPPLRVESMDHRHRHHPIRLDTKTSEKFVVRATPEKVATLHGSIRKFTSPPREGETAKEMQARRKPFVLPEIKTILGTTDEFSTKFFAAAQWVEWVWGGAPHETKTIDRRGGDVDGKVLGMPMPSYGRTYIRQYAYLPLQFMSSQHLATMNQVMLSFRKFRVGVMTIGRVLGYTNSLGFWGPVEEVLATHGNDKGYEGRPPDQASVSTRRYAWSFFGEISPEKSDRIHMKSALLNASAINGGLGEGGSQKMNNFVCCNGTDIETYYRESVFVPVGRGYVSLDCSRLYEGAAAGAIPVLVSKKISEFGTSFSFSGGGPFLDPGNDLIGFDDEDIQSLDPSEKRLLSRSPPFLFAKTWENAVQVMKKLLDNPRTLEQRRRKCSEWFMNLYHFMQEALVFGLKDGGLGEKQELYGDMKTMTVEEKKTIP